MKTCKRCDGYGNEQVIKEVDGGIGFGSKECSGCKGKGEVETFGDKFNFIILCFGYGCLGLLIYALLFGKVWIG